MTEDFILRPACLGDREKITEIFTASFGDGEAFVRDLLQSAALLSSAYCAEAEGEVRSCMFAFDGLGLGGMKLSYLYALCTEPRWRGRGLGRATAEYAALMSRQRGADGVFLRAADEGLEKYYISALDAVPVGGFEYREVLPSPSSAKARATNSQEYLRLRQSAWELSPAIIACQDCIHRHYGGAFLALGENSACCELRDEGLLIREMSGPEPEAMLSAAAEYFGLKSLRIMAPSPDGEPLLLLPPFPGKIPDFSIPFPYFLD